MPAKTQKIFDVLRSRKELEGFTLIGGTALSIQLGHRLSEDLDFCCFSEKLNSRTLDFLINDLKSAHSVRNMTSPSQISQSRINGQNCMDYARDYSIDGVKVTFFARSDVPYQYFSKLNVISPKTTTFNIAQSNSVFTMKSWLLSKRSRSRDLYDLMELIKQSNFTLADILLEAKKADSANYSEEAIKDVLLGNIPLDKDDEGFDSIEVQVKLAEIYDFFKNEINEYEADFAASIVKSNLKSKGL